MRQVVQRRDDVGSRLFTRPALRDRRRDLGDSDRHLSVRRVLVEDHEGLGFDALGYRHLGHTVADIGGRLSL